jgi:mRNA interferase YafQ
MLKPTFTKPFKRDYKLMERRNKNIQEIDTVMGIIKREIPLPPVYKEHPLSGKYKGALECHIEPDWLLIYKVDDGNKTVVFHRTGIHVDLFDW